MRPTFTMMLAGSALSMLLGCSGGAGTAPSPPAAPTTTAQAAPPPAQFPTPLTELQSGPITFSGLGDDGTPVNTYAESGFTVQASGRWQAGANYGNPRPFIRFQALGGTTVTGEIHVTGGGATFRFTAVDLYSSTTPVPYQITGLRNTATVFTVSETLPNTFGRFRTVSNPDPVAVIDTLRITLTNAAAPCCANPMGVDNITLVK